MALECKKTSSAGLVVSNLSKVLPQNDNDQRPLVGTMNHEGDHEGACDPPKKKTQADVDVREVYFLIMHFLSDGPCRKTCAQLKNELAEYKLLPRRYHAWYSRSGACSGDDKDDGISLPLSYSQLLERFSFIEKNHLVKLLEELYNRNTAWGSNGDAKNPTAVDASTLLGTGSVSLLNTDSCGTKQTKCYWNQVGQNYGLTLREIGGGMARHHRAPSIRAASYHIVKPSVLVNRIKVIKTFRGHRNAVYCAIFDKSGEYIITGSDDRLVKIWSTATGFCLCSCRGHEGDITDLAVSANNILMASASNDCFIRVWRFPDGLPVSVLKGHTSAVTAIAFSPRQGCEHHLLSTSDDGTCRIWDARDSSVNARIYAPKLEGQETAKVPESGPSNAQLGTQILCCAFNASGTVFVTGSADKLARVWDACKWSDEVHGAPNHEFDTLKGHEDDVNYVQFSGCAAPSRPVNMDTRPVNVGAPAKNDRLSRFRNSWFGYESIVSCSRDGSAIIWAPRPRKYHGKSRWMKGYHLRVPPPPMPPQPPRGVPRQRLLPTPRGVNMIVWSLDNRYVLAAIMDCRICVWNAVDGSLVHSLTGHTNSTFVLDVHPYDPRIAMSAGYDGRVFVWDIWEGCTIHEYHIGEFHLVDGKFSPDGTSIVISDEVGQIYLLATGEGRTQKDAKYDQFFLGDYRPLIRDVQGNVLDQETQLSPHQRNVQDLLCDANMIPYAEPYQSMFQQRRLGAIGINWQPPPAQWLAGSLDDSSYLAIGFPLLPPPDDNDGVPGAHQGGTRWVEQPIDEDAMEWEQDSVDDAGSDYTLSFENACDEDERECSLTSSEELLDSLEEEDSSEDDEQSQRGSLRRSERNKRKEEEAVTTSGGRSNKRKHRDGGRDYSLRRSKRHQKNKTLSKKSSLRRELGGEQSRRRPKRLAARNARLIFSRISAEEDEQSDSDSSQNVESDGEEQLSSRQSLEKEDDDKDNLEKPDEGSTAEADPSEADCSRPRRSNRSEKLRVSSRNALKEGTSAQVAEADASSPRNNPEEQVHASPTSTCKALNVSSCQHDEHDLTETVGGGQDSSTETRNRGQKSGSTHGTLDLQRQPLEFDAGSSLGYKRRREGKSLKIKTCARAESSSEEPSQVNKDELINSQSGDAHVADEVPGDGVNSSHDYPQKIGKVGIVEGIAGSHDVDGSDMLCSDDTERDALQSLETRVEGLGPASEDSLDQQRLNCLVDGHGMKRPEPTDESNSVNEVLEKTRSQDNNVGGQETTAEAELANQSCERLKLSNASTDNQNEQAEKTDDQEYISSFEHDDERDLMETNSSQRVKEDETRSAEDASLKLFEDIDTIQEEQLESNPPNHNTEGEIDLLVKERGEYQQPEGTGPFSVISEDETFHSDKEACLIEEVCVKSPISSVNLQGKPIKVTIAGPRKHQSVGTSWQHNSPTCLWLRQCAAEARDAEPSSSEDERNSDGENTTDKLGQCHESGQEHHLKLTFRRGKRKTMKPRKRADMQPNPPPVVDVHEFKDMTEPIVQKIESGLDDDELPSQMRVTRTYFRTRRNGDAEKSGISVQGKRANEGNDNDLRIERREGLRFSMRPRSSFNHGDQGRVAEDFPLKGKRGSKRKVSWLMLAKVEDGTRYIPQLGDEVAYVLQGQDEFPYLAQLEDKGAPKGLRARLRAVEFCQVVGIEYGTLAAFSGVTCKLTLRLIDEDCKAFGKTFRLSLPELTNFPDFIIERSRYEVSIRRSWTKRDRCKVWWRINTVDENGDEKTGEWYIGRVVSVEAKSPQFPDSPWEECVVQYKGDSTGPHRHSPWELFDVDSVETVPSRMDEANRLRILSTIEDVEASCASNQDEYSFRALAKLLHKPDFLSKTLVPLSLDIIRERLNNNYYRSLDALQHDIQLLATNVQNYLFDDELTFKVQRLADLLLGEG